MKKILIEILIPKFTFQINSSEDQNLDCNHSAMLRVAGVCRSNLVGALSCRKFQRDADIKFCKEFWSRNAAKLNQSQKEEVEDLSIVICSNVCSDDAVLSPAITKAVKRFEEILDRRHAELLAVGASSVSSLSLSIDY